MPEQKSKSLAGKLMIAGAALVIVIVAVFAAVAFRGEEPKSPRAREVARYLTSDLQGLAGAEVVAKMTTGKYTTDYERVGKMPTVGVNPPEMKVTDDGWSAVVSSKELPGVRCAIGVGVRNPLSWSAKSGEVACRE